MNIEQTVVEKLKTLPLEKQQSVLERLRSYNLKRFRKRLRVKMGSPLCQF